MPALITRPYANADESYVYARWKESFRDSHCAGPYPPDLYFPTADEAIRRLIARPSTRCLVLEDTEHGMLVGFICAEPRWQRWSKRRRQLEEFDVVHYLYIDTAVRGNGLARRLIAAAGVRPERSAYSFSTVASKGVLGMKAAFLPDAGRYPSSTGAKTT